MYPGLVLVAAVGLVRVGHGAGGLAGRWVVAGGCLSIIFYLVNCMYYCNLCHSLF